MTSYWESFYTQHAEDPRLLRPSRFCEFILDHFKHSPNLSVLDAGCGTGRDAVALSQAHNVTGVDLVKQKEHTGFTFEKADFCTYEKHKFDMVYSRFTYHTINDKQQDVFLDSITEPETYLCMEFRSDKGQDTLLHFGKTHYRNFINFDKFKQKVQEKFDIMYISEDTGFAPFGDEDPICIRAILRKK